MPESRSDHATTEARQTRDEWAALSAHTAGRTDLAPEGADRPSDARTVVPHRWQSLLKRLTWGSALHDLTGPLALQAEARSGSRDVGHGNHARRLPGAAMLQEIGRPPPTHGQ